MNVNNPFDLGSFLCLCLQFNTDDCIMAIYKLIKSSFILMSESINDNVLAQVDDVRDSFSNNICSLRY